MMLHYKIEKKTLRKHVSLIYIHIVKRTQGEFNNFFSKNNIGFSCNLVVK
jgi:hypothetical protein